MFKRLNNNYSKIKKLFQHMIAQYLKKNLPVRVLFTRFGCFIKNLSVAYRTNGRTLIKEYLLIKISCKIKTIQYSITMPTCLTLM